MEYKILVMRRMAAALQTEEMNMAIFSEEKLRMAAMTPATATRQLTKSR